MELMLGLREWFNGPRESLAETYAASTCWVLVGQVMFHANNLEPTEATKVMAMIVLAALGLYRPAQMCAVSLGFMTGLVFFMPIRWLCV